MVGSHIIRSELQLVIVNVIVINRVKTHKKQLKKFRPIKIKGFIGFESKEISFKRLLDSIVFICFAIDYVDNFTSAYYRVTLYVYTTYDRVLHINNKPNYL